MFSKILIANRGEIACRIIRTARRLGVSTVAVYSDADRDAMHVALADEAMFIGPAPAAESYLCGDKIIAAAKRSGAQAVHPGYGFLSENAGFAQECADAGLVFVGPPPEAIRAMGDKSAAKSLMERAGVPVLPGYHGTVQEARLLEHEAARIGYPVLIKPSAGGGGKGMKIAASGSAFAAALASARREANAAFGDSRVLVEKYVASSRHVEVQIFADAHGRYVHLFDRDCSIQRRHQKIIEEAPAPFLAPDLRRRMAEAAVAAAQAVRYVGAGTVEFLVAPEPGGFYFMEMNARLQVEHPVTEAITGLDLVEWQLRVAAGAALPLEQGEIACSGSAIEARLYAEDPDRQFLPQAGRLARIDLPAPGPGLRVDAGVRSGDEISVFYDPLTAKIIASGADRTAALARLRGALDEIAILGPATNLLVLRAIAANAEFAAKGADTGFLAQRAAELLAPAPPASNGILALAAAGLLAERAAAAAQPGEDGDVWSPWRGSGGFRLNEEAQENILLRETSVREAPESAIGVAYGREGWRLTLPDGETLSARGALAKDGALAIDLDGRRRAAVFARAKGDIWLFIKGEPPRRFALIDPAARPAGPEAAAGRLAAAITAPMPGRIVACLVEAGTRVKADQPVIVLEAMKMEHTLCALVGGVVSAVRFKPGDRVGEGDELAAIEAGS